MGAGFLDHSSANTQNTNTQLLLDAKYAAFAPYISAARVYHCPSDPTTVKIMGALHPRLRSYGMNYYVGVWPERELLDYREGNPLTRLSGIVRPSKLFVGIDKHPDFIGHTFFNCIPGWVGEVFANREQFFYDYPASQHNGVGVVSFADGHVELHKWVDARTKIPIQNVPLGWALDDVLDMVASRNNRDALWLFEHNSQRSGK